MKETHKQEKISFTCHEKTAYKGFIGALFFVAILETAGVSLLLYNWNLYVHYAHLLINIVFMGFLFIDTKRVVNSPIWLQDETLHLAIGVRPKIAIPLSNIEEIFNGSLHYEELRKEKNALDLSLLITEDPTLELIVKEPIPYKTFFGQEIQVKHVFFFVDDKEKLLSQLKKYQKEEIF